MPKKRIHKDRSTDTRPKTRNRVECNCTLHCNGSKWVDPRTFERHQQEIERFCTITSVPQSTSQFRSSMSSSVDVGSSSTLKRRRKQEEEEEEGQDSSNSSYSDSDESNQTDYQEPINIPTKRKRYPKFRQTDRKSTRLNSSHLVISYAVFCLKKKNNKDEHHLFRVQE